MDLTNTHTISGIYTDYTPESMTVGIEGILSYPIQIQRLPGCYRVFTWSNPVLVQITTTNNETNAYRFLSLNDQTNLNIADNWDPSTQQFPVMAVSRQGSIYQSTSNLIGYFSRSPTNAIGLINTTGDPIIPAPSEGVTWIISFDFLITNRQANS